MAKLNQEIPWVLNFPFLTRQYFAGFYFRDLNIGKYEKGVSNFAI